MIQSYGCMNRPAFPPSLMPVGGAGSGVTAFSNVGRLPHASNAGYAGYGGGPWAGKTELEKLNDAYDKLVKKYQKTQKQLANAKAKGKDPAKIASLTAILAELGKQTRELKRQIVKAGQPAQPGPNTRPVTITTTNPVTGETVVRNVPLNPSVNPGWAASINAAIDAVGQGLDATSQAAAEGEQTYVEPESGTPVTADNLDAPSTGPSPIVLAVGAALVAALGYAAYKRMK